MALHVYGHCCYCLVWFHVVDQVPAVVHQVSSYHANKKSKAAPSSSPAAPPPPPSEAEACSWNQKWREGQIGSRNKITCIQNTNVIILGKNIFFFFRLNCWCKIAWPLCIINHIISLSYITIVFKDTYHDSPYLAFELFASFCNFSQAKTYNVEVDQNECYHSWFTGAVY